MKVILVDAINTLVSKEGEIFEEMHKLLEKYPNRKIILTGANDEQIKQFGLDKMPYDIFTLKHDPEKTNPEYYKKMLNEFSMEARDVVYFEHDPEAVKSAESIGIETFYYDKDKRDLESLEEFLNKSLQ